MKDVYKSVEELIGNTPIVELSRFSSAVGLNHPLFGKLESFNPAGSIKDRSALSMIEHAEQSGRLCKDTVLIEPTSGNAGIGMALIAAVRGFRLILTMPESMSIERRNLLAAYGAELVLTPAEEGMCGAIEKADALSIEYPNSLIMGQFSDPANPAAHRRTTGPEIWECMQGEISAFVAGVGTGGTISGAGGYLKEKDPCIHIMAVEPKSSSTLTDGSKGSHKIQGIGAGFVPENFNRTVVDEIFTVSDEDAIAYTRLLTKTEGLLCGISTGAALFAAANLARRPVFNGKNVLVILPDSGERYLSML